VGCGRRAPKQRLLRVALVDGALAPDREARLPGRGAYLCPGSPGCWERARARGAFARAFRRPVEVPVQPLNLSD
jgi:predicted RNA-binding protein YlxR (DUF448 family)